MDNKKKLWQFANFQDAVFVIICAVSLLSYSLYHHATDKNTSEWKTSPFLFPVLISVFGILLAVSLVADAMRDMKTQTALAGAESTSGHTDLKGVLVFISVSIIYYFALPHLKFIISTLLYLLVLFLYLGERKWWKLLLLCGITTGAIYFLFGVALHVHLP